MLDPIPISELPSVSMIYSTNYDNLATHKLKRLVDYDPKETDVYVVDKTFANEIISGQLYVAGVKDNHPPLIFVPGSDVYLNPIEQINLAEWLIQKAKEGIKVMVGTNVFVTMRAIEVHALVNDVDDINFYMAENDSVELTDDITIFRSLNEGFKLLNKIEYTYLQDYDDETETHG